MMAVRGVVTVMVMVVATSVLSLRMVVVLLMILWLHNISATLDSELILSGDSHLRVLCAHDK